jgi:hypothetical protein
MCFSSVPTIPCCIISPRQCNNYITVLRWAPNIALNVMLVSLDSCRKEHIRFKFTSVDDVERTVQEFRDQCQSECLIFHISATNTPHRRSLHIHDSRILRLKMPRTHDMAAGEFAKILILNFGEMHVHNQVTSQCSGLMEMGNVSKEADGSWGPVGEDYVTCMYP